MESDQTAPGAVYSGSTLFVFMPKLFPNIIIYMQQTTSAEHFSIAGKGLTLQGYKFQIFKILTIILQSNLKNLQCALYETLTILRLNGQLSLKRESENYPEKLL